MWQVVLLRCWSLGTGVEGKEEAAVVAVGEVGSETGVDGAAEEVGTLVEAEMLLLLKLRVLKEARENTGVRAR